MNPHITRRRRSGGVTVPIVANQTIEFGQRTLADMGDAPIVNTGASIASATIDSGSTNATTHFQFEVYGGTAYLQSQVNGGLTNTPYTLNCTFTSTAGKTDTATITVNTSGTTDNGADLTLSYSVAPSSLASAWQLNDTLSTTGGTGPQFGNFILLRAGVHDGDLEDINRGVNFGGTFNPPDQFLEVNAGEPAGHKGYDTVDYSGGTINWMTLMPHSDSDNPTINRLYLNCTSGVNAGFKGLKISRVAFSRSDDVTVDVTNPGLSTSAGAYLTLRNNLWDWVCVEDCSFVGEQTMTGYTDIPVFIGIITAASAQPNLIIKNNYFSNVWNAVCISTSSTATHDDLNIIGNIVVNCWGDTFFLKHGDDVKVNWNEVYNAKSAYLALGPFFTSLWDSPIHKDLIHCRNTSTGAANAANFQAIGNISYRANGTAAAYPLLTSDGPSNYDGETGGSIFIENPSATGVYTNALIEGNFLVGDHPSRAIVLNTGTGYIRGNTVVSHDPGNYGASISDNRIRLYTGTTGVVVQANITEAVVDNLGSGSQTITPNTVISRTSGAGVLDKVSTFEDAYDVQGQELPGTDTFDTNFVIKTTSEAYTASTPAGTYDVDYESRNLTLPWYKGTLYMDFRGGVYQGKTAADMTVTRTTAGTSLDSAGNIVSFGSGVARITDLGLLVEEARTNVAQYSEDLSNAFWAGTNVTITTNAVAAPDGTTTADKMVENTANSTHLKFNNAVGVSAGSTTAYTWSCFVKAAERTIVHFSSKSASVDYRTWFNLSGSGSVLTDNASNTSSIQALANGWYRIVVTRTVTSGEAIGFTIGLATADNVVTYTGDGTSGAYFWGLQIELGAFATSYIPSTGGAATARNSDVITMTSTAFSDWYSAASGITLFAETFFLTSSAATTVIQYVAAISDTTTNNRAAFFRVASTNNSGARLVSGGSSTNPADITSAVVLGSANKWAIASAIGASQGIACANGTLSTASSPAAMPVSPTTLTLGVNENSGAFWLNGYIRKIIFIPSRLSNAELQALTT